jgi:hypothetical protein
MPVHVPVVPKYSQGMDNKVMEVKAVPFAMFCEFFGVIKFCRSFVFLSIRSMIFKK